MDLPQRRRAAVAGLAAAFTVGGCTEYQFLLRVRDEQPVSVVSHTEAIRRQPAERVQVASDRAGPEPFADPGVVLADGYMMPYERDGDWIESVAPIRTRIAGGRASIGFSIHPGHRDLPLVLETGATNVCELRTRSRPARDLGYFLITAGATVGAFVIPATATADDATTRGATPYVAVATGSLVLGGLAMVLWPPGTDRLVSKQACNPRQ